MRKVPVELLSWQEFFQSRIEISAVYLFGSFGTEFEHPQSDIDLGIVFTRQVTLPEELELDVALSLHLSHDQIDVDKDIIQRKLSFIDLKLGNLEALKRMKR